VVKVWGRGEGGEGRGERGGVLSHASHRQMADGRLLFSSPLPPLSWIRKEYRQLLYTMIDTTDLQEYRQYGHWSR
jgi:hypothetical protein